MSRAGPYGERVKAKWRPGLSLIVFLMLGIVLTLPLFSLYFFRIYENQLVREAEGELLAQGAALAAIIRRDLATTLPANAPLGEPIPPDGLGRAGLSRGEPIHDGADLAPMLPTIDLARDPVLPRRPDAEPAPVKPDAAYLAVGQRMAPLLAETRRATLAGFRLLDPRGVIIAGRDDVGLSLAHVEEVAAALAGRRQSVLRLRVSQHLPPPVYSLSRGTAVRVFLALPVAVNGRVGAVIYASRTPSNVFRHLYQERGKVLFAVIPVAILTLCIGLAFHRLIMRPVRELIARTAAIGRGDRTALRPLGRHGTAEFATLSQSFLDMAHALNTRSDFINTFAAHVSHELKSPLTAIEGAAELLREDLDAGDMTLAQRRRFLDNIVADTRRLAAIANRLRELARAESAPTGGSSRVDAVVDALQGRFPDLAVSATGHVAARLAISQENLQILLSHLADNASRHRAHSLRINVRNDGAMIALDIRDDGDGISANNSPKVFESFYTTRRDSGGTGMGLAIVRALLTAHGGSISLSENDPGAHFTIKAPRAVGDGYADDSGSGPVA